MFKKSNKKAFTIVELVIVIAVIAILMGILFVGGNHLVHHRTSFAALSCRSAPRMAWASTQQESIPG